MQNKTWWLPLSVVLVATFWLQMSLFLHPDMLYLLHAAKRLLMGGTYTHDFFETNPPLIFYLYMPVIWLSQITHLSDFAVFRLYILLYSFITLQLCYHLSLRLDISTPLRTLLLISLIISTLFLPVHEFGQRDHLMMLCVFPYMFALILRLEGKPISFLLALTIGLYASLGIGLKPFFLATPILLELYYWYTKKRFTAIFRTETFTIGICLVSYMVFVFVYFPDYFHVVLPIVNDLYFVGTTASASLFFSNLFIDYSLAGIAIYLIVRPLRSLRRHRFISDVLFISLLGFTIAFSIPHSTIFYHIVPAFSTAYILFAFLFSQLIYDQYCMLVEHYQHRKMVLSICLVICAAYILAMPLYSMAYAYQYIYHAKYAPYTLQYFEFFQAQHEPTYLYLSNSNDLMLFNSYANGHYVGRYPFFWWAQGLDRVEKTNKIKNDETYLVNMIAQNLAEEKPRFVLVDTETPGMRFFGRSGYLTEFMHYAAFKAEWANYHYRTTIGRFKIYELNS